MESEKEINKKEKTHKEQSLKAPYKLKLLFTIVNREKYNFYLSILEEHDVQLQTVLYGYGTAPDEIKNMLGLIDNKKAIIISLVKENKIKEILTSFEDKYFKMKNCNGIAYTIPISSIIGTTVYNFLINNKRYINNEK